MDRNGKTELKQLTGMTESEGPEKNDWTTTNNTFDKVKT